MGQSLVTVMSTTYVVAIILVVYHRNIERLEKLVKLPGARGQGE
ncbi:MAG TPA: hypothetical protein VKG24_27200 [Pseudolabrys sp.]|jgi:UDP-N-acetylenolpyruvoylglucosamine reductase|nr:hypothetical protein [Pseudolabrys sp.]